mgnify:FL=1
MPEPIADDVLCYRGFEVLEEELGPVETLRFLSLISRQPFEYQEWRRKHFAGMRLSDILAEAQSVSE